MGATAQRYALTAAGLLATLAALVLVRPDPTLSTELIAERAGRTLLDQLPADRSAALVTEGPDSCRRGVVTAWERRRGETEGGEPVTIRCHVSGGEVVLEALVQGQQRTVRRRLPSWWSVLPPILAVFVALGTRRLLLGLALAVWLGAVLSNGLDPTLGLVPAIRDVIWASLADQFRLTIVLFTSSLVGMANVTSRAGGAKGIALAIAGLARGTRSTRLATFLMGLALFFDDYANCIVVGTTMRPLADRVQLSREKLAYIVDSTAAPVAGVAIISTWVGYEVSLFDDLAAELALSTGGYDLFLRILPSRFYCFLTLAFVLIGTLMSRDFGPMLTAERRALRQGKVMAEDAKPLTSAVLTRVSPVLGVEPRWQVAALPVAIVIVGTLAGLIWSGASTPEVARWAAQTEAHLWDGAFLRRSLQAADGAFVLLTAALAGSIAAFAMGLSRRVSGEPRPKEARTRPAMLLAAALLPLGLGLIVVVIHGAAEIGLIRALSPQRWGALLARGDMTVIVAGAALSAAVLVAIVVARMILERRSEALTFPMTVRSLSITWLAGARAMAMAICILVLAWSIQKVCADLDTPVYLVASLSGVLHPLVLPLLVFLLSAAVAFSTGTSWGTMGILIPTVMPLAYHFGGLPLVLISAGAVLDGAIFGDHCSPISDTTVLSSIATSCDHIHHVRTQLPYAMTCMGLALALYLGVSAGAPRWLGYGLALAAIVGLFRGFGRPAD